MKAIEKIKTLIKKGRLFCSPFFIILCLTTFYPQGVEPEIIWQIGDKDDTCGEFLPSENLVIEYQVPTDWKEKLGQEPYVWLEFPPSIYPAGDQALHTQELRINFDYPEEYSDPVLRIIAAGYSRITRNHLEVFQGETLIGQGLVEIPYYTFFDFPLGNIKKGIDEGNWITIRNIPDQETTSLYASPILFDAIYLDDFDIDGDGVCDSDEGDGDWDQDGLADSADTDTVFLPMESDNPSVIKKILIDIVESENTALSFQKVRFIDPNSLNLPGWLMSNRSLPYGFLGFRIEGIGPKEEVLLQMSFEDQIYSSLRLYTYQDTNDNDDWHEIAYRINGSNNDCIVNIILSDGGDCDRDKEKNGLINTCLAISYPYGLDLNVEDSSCFIKTLYGSRH